MSDGGFVISVFDRLKALFGPAAVLLRASDVNDRTLQQIEDQMKFLQCQSWFSTANVKSRLRCHSIRTKRQ